MSIKSDKWITEMALKYNMISNFQKNQIKINNTNNKVISYGISSYGYDVRCSNEFRIFTNTNLTIIDPKSFKSNGILNIKSDICIIPPNSFVLSRTIEYLKIPRNIFVICIGKSTYARCGIMLNVTPLEPEWEGYITIEFANTTSLPVKVYANEGIAQLIFMEIDEICKTSYKDRNGKYQNQMGITYPKI